MGANQGILDANQVCCLLSRQRGSASVRVLHAAKVVAWDGGERQGESRAVNVCVCMYVLFCSLEAYLGCELQVVVGTNIEQRYYRVAIASPAMASQGHGHLRWDFFFFLLFFFFGSDRASQLYPRYRQPLQKLTMQLREMQMHAEKSQKKSSC